MKRTKKLALMALLTAMALVVFVIEAQIPAPVPVPGVKLGLANVITLTTMLLLGRKEAGTVLLVRIIMGSMFAGGLSALIYSMAGGALAYLIMCLLLKPLGGERVWALSALAAVGHNVGQIAACVLIVKTPGIWGYLPVLVISGVVTGIFTGFAAMYLVKALDKSGIMK